jgi:hypothetical protein
MRLNWVLVRFGKSGSQRSEARVRMQGFQPRVRLGETVESKFLSVI